MPIISGGGGGGGSSSVLTAEVPLTNAQIIALGNATPVTVAAAPGLGSFLNFIAGLLTVDATAVAYGNINASASIFFGTDAVTGISVPISSGTMTAVLGGDGEIATASFVPAFAIIAGNAEMSYLDASEADNLPLVLACFNNAAGPFSGGDAANSGRVKVWYTIETLP